MERYGYHFLVTKDGKAHKCRPVASVGAHTLGENSDSIGICLTGDKEFSCDQIFSLAWLIRDLLDEYPEITEIRPHRDYTDVGNCPNFDLAIFNLQTS